ncbi:MAG: hypothetical protein LBF78_09540 [Treponema sp.]|jgi:hypothetical protein|nr:hypothetical protein [Treponema sp.]
MKCTVTALHLSILCLLFTAGCALQPSTREADPDKQAQAEAREAAARMDELLQEADAGNIFLTNSPAKTPTIGILKPSGSYLGPGEEWLLDMVKSAMTNNFRKFAAGRITVMNLSDEASLYAEVERSLSGPGDELSLTARLSARSIMTGSLIKDPLSNRYTCEFAVTDTETHAILASYSRLHSDIELTGGMAVNKATESLLKDLGVRLNDAGITALYVTSNEADTALAKGFAAALKGNSLQAMNYLFNAASFNSTASQAQGPLAEVQTRNRIEVQGAGAIVMDFFERQELWQNRLTEYHNFYTSHPPFEVYYTPPVPLNMRGSGDLRTYDLNFKIGLRWNQNQIDIMERILEEYILDGLYKNTADEIARWELRHLPEDSELFQGPENFNFNLTVNVENEWGDVLSSGPVKLSGSLYRYKGKIYADCTQEYDAFFNNIEYKRDTISPQLYVRIAEVNGMNIESAGENGFVRVSQIQGMPPEQLTKLPGEFIAAREREMARLRKTQEKIAAKAERERAAAQRAAEREAEREQKRYERENNPLKNFRIGFGMEGGPIFRADSGTFGFGLDVGIKNFFMEIGLLHYFSINYDAAERDVFQAVNMGLGATYIGRLFLFDVGGGITFFEEPMKEYVIYPYLKAKLDWHLGSVFYLRLGYRLDFYAEDDYYTFFGGEKKDAVIGRIPAHSAIFGLAIYL